MSLQSEGSFTSFTFGVLPEVNKENARRGNDNPLLFTSFTSFSEGGVIHAVVGAPASAHFTLSPIRDTGERSEREWSNLLPYVDYLVHFRHIDEVNEVHTFTSGVAR